MSHALWAFSPRLAKILRRRDLESHWLDGLGTLARQLRRWSLGTDSAVPVSLVIVSARLGTDCSGLGKVHFGSRELFGSVVSVSATRSAPNFCGRDGSSGLVSAESTGKREVLAAAVLLFFRFGIGYLALFNTL